jgi:gamma-glutamylcysteine synthetase
VADGLNELITTTDASVEQFTEYLNDIHAFCLKHGKYLSTPDDLKYVME